MTSSSAPTPHLAVTAGVANQATQVSVSVYNQAVAPPVLVAGAFSVQVLC